jgi:glycosyltransferase involved in cell wall biosynthesis
MKKYERNINKIYRKPIKLGIFFDQRILVGGGFQQSLNAALLAKKLSNDIVSIRYFTNIKENINFLKSFDLEVELLEFNFFQKALLILHRLARENKIFFWTSFILRFNVFNLYVKKNKFDLIYFLSPTTLAANLENTNFIITIWDLCHRDYPEFPEVRSGKNFSSREFLYNNVLKKSAAIITESTLGKSNLITRYGIDESRIHILQFSPSIATQIKKYVAKKNISKKFNLQTEYIFYPAQFWPHKNHIYLLRGIKILEDSYGIKIAVIFSGGDQGNMEYIRKIVKKFGLSNRVHFSGFVSSQEIVDLYKHSFALVMPSYFGPTNLPPLEAFYLGVPVLYSDLPGFREQVGKAALLMDLNDPRSMAYQLNRLYKNPKLKVRLTNEGRKILKQFDNKKRLLILEKIIINFSNIRDCWE